MNAHLFIMPKVDEIIEGQICEDKTKCYVQSVKSFGRCPRCRCRRVYSIRWNQNKKCHEYLVVDMITNENDGSQSELEYDSDSERKEPYEWIYRKMSPNHYVYKFGLGSIGYDQEFGAVHARWFAVEKPFFTLYEDEALNSNGPTKRDLYCKIDGDFHFIPNLKDFISSLKQYKGYVIVEPISSFDCNKNVILVIDLILKPIETLKEIFSDFINEQIQLISASGLNIEGSTINYGEVDITINKKPETDLLGSILVETKKEYDPCISETDYTINEPKFVNCDQNSEVKLATVLQVDEIAKIEPAQVYDIVREPNNILWRAFVFLSSAGLIILVSFLILALVDLKEFRDTFGV